MYIYIYIPVHWLVGRVFTNCSGDKGSHQRLKKWYLMLPCITLSITRYVSRVKWSNPEKGVAPSQTRRSNS